MRSASGARSPPSHTLEQEPLWGARIGVCQGPTALWYQPSREGRPPPPKPRGQRGTSLPSFPCLYMSLEVRGTGCMEKVTHGGERGRGSAGPVLTPDSSDTSKLPKLSTTSHQPQLKQFLGDHPLCPGRILRGTPRNPPPHILTVRGPPPSPPWRHPLTLPTPLLSSPSLSGHCQAPWVCSSVQRVQGWPC